jgi:hypothetical protein
LTLAETGRIFGYWERHPPVYQLVSIIAQMLGWKPRQRAAIETEADWAQQVASVPGIGVDSDPAAKALAGAAIYDFDELRRRYRAAN